MDINNLISILIVVFLSIALFAATEFFFPIAPNDPIAVKQKHFWAIMFLILSLVIGLPITISFNTDRKVDEAKELLRQHVQQSELAAGRLLAELRREGRFQDLDTIYDKNFTSTDPMLKGWADELLFYIRERWSLGVMPIPRESAAAKIAGVYPEAQKSIIAVNVGSTKFYFDIGTYATSNLNARDKGVPVVRFYLYSKSKHIEMHGGKQPQDIAEFFDEVKELHKRLGSLYSAVIDVDAVRLPEYRDILIMDNKFVAETALSPEWEPIRAEATEDVGQLRRARLYFRDLWGAVDPQHVVAMTDEDVAKYYGHSPSFPPPSANNRAENIFRYLMNSIAGPL